MNTLKQNFTKLLAGLFGVMFFLIFLSMFLAASLQAAEIGEAPAGLSSERAED